MSAHFLCVLRMLRTYFTGCCLVFTVYDHSSQRAVCFLTTSLKLFLLLPCGVRRAVPKVTGHRDVFPSSCGSGDGDRRALQAGAGWSRVEATPVYSLHSWPSSSPWAQSRWKSQACPSWRTVPFQQVKELCRAILEPGDVPREYTDTFPLSVWLAPGIGWPHGKATRKALLCPAIPTPRSD